MCFGWGVKDWAIWCNVKESSVKLDNGIFYWISWTLESDKSPFPSTVLLCCKFGGPQLPLLNLPTPNLHLSNKLRCRSPRDVGGFQFTLERGWWQSSIFFWDTAIFAWKVSEKSWWYVGRPLNLQTHTANGDVFFHWIDVWCCLRLFDMTPSWKIHVPTETEVALHNFNTPAWFDVSETEPGGYICNLIIMLEGNTVILLREIIKITIFIPLWKQIVCR